MTTQEFIERINVLFARRERYAYLEEVLLLLHQFHEALKPYLNNVIGAPHGSSAFVNTHSQLTSELGRMSNMIRELRVQELFRNIDSLRVRLNVLGSSSLMAQIAETLIQQLDTFSGTYENLLKAYSGEATFNAVESADSLFLSLQALDQTLTLTQKGLMEGTNELKDGEAELIIVLGGEMLAESFAERLVALNAIYAELCSLLNVSSKTNPLRIGKIESGSLFARIFGQSQIIGLMTRLIENGIHYLHRNYTREGKIAAIPRQVEVVESILHLKSELEQCGINTPTLDEHLIKSSIVIAQKLNALLQDGMIVKVNQVTYSIVDPEHFPKTLPDVSVLAIEPKNSSANDANQAKT